MVFLFLHHEVVKFQIDHICIVCFSPSSKHTSFVSGAVEVSKDKTGDANHCEEDSHNIDQFISGLEEHVRQHHHCQDGETVQQLRRRRRRRGGG